MTIILVTIIIILAVTGLPIFAFIGGLAIVLFLSIGQDIGLLMGDAYKIAITPGLLSLPLFVFAGYLLSETNVSKRILRFFTALLGWIPGGVVIASLVATAIFTAFTGISIVTIVAFGGVLYPLLKQMKYSDHFSYGVITSIGPLGILLPPCIVVVLYGIVAQVNIRGLYIAGILPILLCFIVLATYAGVISVMGKVPRTPFILKEFFISFWEIKYEATIAIIIIVGIFGGFFTVNDAASFTTIYFIIVEIFILKEVNVKQVPSIMEASMKMLGAVFFIVGVAMSFANYLIFCEIPMQLLEWVKISIHSKLSFLIVLNLFLIVVGMAIDMFTAILVVVPMILPISNYFGVNPYHLGVIFLLNLEIGFITPPVGINLFVSAMRFNKSVVEIFKFVIPFLVLLLITLGAVTYWEFLSTYLVNLLGIKSQIVI
jgi:tripartite ATP-independent transporter DctM subunit